MEKIYVEGNNQQQQKQNSNKRLFQVSVVLSFLVAAFAIVSIIAVGFNQVSYAADDEVAETDFDFEVDQEFEEYRLVYIDTEQNEHSFKVNDFYDTDKNPLFCLEYDKDIPSINTEGNPDDVNLFKQVDKKLDDEGIKYILSKSGIYGVSSILDPSEFTDYEDYIVAEKIATQAAIWLYNGSDLNDGNLVEPSDNKSLCNYNLVDDEDYSLCSVPTEPGSVPYNIKVITGASRIIYYKNNNNYNFYFNDNIGLAIKNVVIAAKQGATPLNKKVSILTDGEFALNSDETFYQSSEISVSGTDDLDGYYVDLDSDIDGLYVVDEDGNEVDIKKQMFSGADKFYLRIPKDKVDSQGVSIKINVRGEFNTYLNDVVYGYKNDDSTENRVQYMFRFSPGSSDASKTLEIVAAEDTGISRTQTVYFIGLIVLLCGIGIIYANAKPIKNN